MSKNSSYTTNKQTGEFECVRCDFKATTKSEICKHVFDEKKRENRLTQFDLHRIKKCGKNSRICRYCHPEDDIKQRDIEESINYYPSNTSLFDAQIIPKLLSLEYRYRHKYSSKHLDQLRKPKQDKLINMIKSRIRKRIKIFNPAMDGKQTPYNAHGIDIAMHNLGVCCRWCLNRWYKISYSKVLNDSEIHEITLLTHHYLDKFIINGSDSMKEFMKEIVKTNVDDMFYKSGKYLFYEMNGMWEVVLDENDDRKQDDTEQFKCGYCDVLFASDVLFMSHVTRCVGSFENNNETSDNIQREVCGYCNESFVKGEQYDAHVKKEEGQFSSSSNKRKRRVDNDSCCDTDDIMLSSKRHCNNNRNKNV